MTAAIFGSTIVTNNAAQGDAVLSDGRIAALYNITYSGYPPTPADAALFVQFYSPDGKALGAQINLDATGAENFNQNSCTDQIVALANGGFQVLAEHGDSANGVTDDLATFDSQANMVDGWSAADSHVDGGHSQLLGLSGGDAYVYWNTDANAAKSFNPLLPFDFYSDGFENNAAEATDAAGAVYNASGTLAAGPFSYANAELSTVAPSNDLAGPQEYGASMQLANGAIAQAYQDEEYVDVPSTDGGSPSLFSFETVSLSIGGEAPIAVYKPTLNTDGSASTSFSDYTGVQAVALHNGTFAVLYTTVTAVANDPKANFDWKTYATFYNEDGSPAPAGTVQLLDRTHNSGGLFQTGGVSVVALQSGGFALSYQSTAAIGADGFVTFYDASGNETQKVTIAIDNQGAPTLFSAPDGSLYAEDASSGIIRHIVGTTPGDLAIDASADTVAETLSAASPTRNYVTAGSGATTILGGVGAASLQGGSGGNLFELQSSAAVVGSSGADTIVGSTGSATINATGAPLFFGAGGATLFNALGASATLVGGGNETINAGSASMLVFGGASGGLDFVAGGGSSTVVSYAGGGTLNGGSAATLYFGIGPTAYNAGSAVDTVIGYGGGFTATGGANGTLFFTGSAGGNVLSTGAGASTIIGFGAGDAYNATGAGAAVIYAAGASSTINAAQSTGGNTLFAFANGDVVFGGSGQTAIESAFGDQTLVGGGGGTLFELLDSGSAHAITIVNFNAASDFVKLQGYVAGAGAVALLTATTSGGSEILRLSDGSTVTFQGATGLTAMSFV